MIYFPILRLASNTDFKSLIRSQAGLPADVNIHFKKKPNIWTIDWVDLVQLVYVEDTVLLNNEGVCVPLMQGSANLMLPEH